MFEPKRNGREQADHMDRMQEISEMREDAFGGGY